METPVLSELFDDAEEWSALQVWTGSAQHIGDRKRQEDSCAIFGAGQGEQDPVFGTLGIVCDGIGGFESGEEASSLAVRTFLASYRTRPNDEPLRDTLVRALFAANDAVHSAARAAGREGNFGTTLVAGVVHQGALHWISAGDSRAYLLRDGVLVQITKDHLYSDELKRKVDARLLSPDAAATHPDRDLLTSYVGSEDLSNIDQNMRALPLQDGDRVILCTDGLYKSLSSDEIVSADAGDPQEIADMLIAQSVRKNIHGQDNLSVVVFALQSPQDREEERSHVSVGNLRRTLILAALTLLLGGSSALLLFLLTQKK